MSILWGSPSVFDPMADFDPTTNTLTDRAQKRPKGLQIVEDQIQHMTMAQIEQFALIWGEREPELLQRFMRAVRELVGQEGDLAP